MQEDIKSKLEKALSKDSFEESDVVYILSRIRKLLEIDNKKTYQRLKFYCDWALHSQIDNTQSIDRELRTIIKDLSSSPQIFYKVFWDDLKIFFKEYQISATLLTDIERIHQFEKKLSNIYSDTPLILKDVKKTRITFELSQETNQIDEKTYYIKGVKLYTEEL